MAGKVGVFPGSFVEVGVLFAVFCMCACVCVRACVRAYVCVRVRVHAHIHTCALCVSAVTFADNR